MKVIQRNDGTVSIFSDSQKLAIEISVSDEHETFGVVARATGIGDTLNASGYKNNHFSYALHGRIAGRDE